MTAPIDGECAVALLHLRSDDFCPIVAVAA
jgi:hypothetical protein